MNPPEQKPEAAINRVLSGLNNAKIPHGMESRILAALEARTIASPHWLFTVPKGWAWTTASFAFIALAFALAKTHHASHAMPEERAAASRPLAPKVRYMQQTPSTPIRTARPHTHDPAVPARVEPEPSEPATEISEDALALSDLHAPSQPAPPMPLTEQEKFLIGLIRRGDPVELAMLDPKFRSSEEANSRADFDRFFAPPPLPKPLPNDTQSTTGDKK